MSAGTLYRELEEKLHGLVLEPELRTKARVAQEILELKAKHRATILAHHFVEPALLYSVADHTGDSLELARRAAETETDMIVMCGVHFMAEVAKILNPDRTVLSPLGRAGCSVADSITAQDVRQLRSCYPGVPVVVCLTTYADVKAEADICCTPSNAVAVVDSLHAETVIFLPDEYLARNVARQTGRHVIFPTRAQADGDPNEEIDFEMIGWSGRCEVHGGFGRDDVTEARREYPDINVLAHPRCSPAVVSAADYACSTAGMAQHVRATSAPHYLLLTDRAMTDNLAVALPHKQLVRPGRRCSHMQRITLAWTLESLRRRQFEILIPEQTRVRARAPLERMLAVG